MSLKQDGYVLPVALIKEDLDTFCLSATVNGESSVLLRLTGLRALLHEVITLDKYRKPTAGPIVNSVQEYIYTIVSFSKKLKLVHRDL